MLISRLTEINQYPLLTQSGREVGRLGVTNGSILDPKCDIHFIPDGVLGAGEAMRRREFGSARDRVSQQRLPSAVCELCLWPQWPLVASRRPGLMTSSQVLLRRVGQR